jgi:hypothetical protein
LYVNGNLVSSQAATGTIFQSSNPLQIGGNSVWGEWFNGLIDEVRIYNRALSQSEIQSDMNTPVGSPLQLLGTAVDGTGEAVLGLEEVRPLYDEAVKRWQQLAPGADVSALHNVTIEVMDLPGTTLGLASSTFIWIDINAAGNGWFVDATPWDDVEFNPGNGLTADRADLLTVLVHEMGHVLGLEDDHAADPYTGGVMAWALPLGVRRISLATPDQPTEFPVFADGVSGQVDVDILAAFFAYEQMLQARKSETDG